MISFFKFRPSLDDLANKYDTDKGTEYPLQSRHGYAPFYDSILSKWRLEPIRMLEVGVCMEYTDGGHSIRMWDEYFENDKTSIYTFDIIDMSSHSAIFNNNRVHFFRGDQGKREDLTSMYDAFGAEPFDFILEDGSHEVHHQLISLAHMFKYVKPGGFYILEDVSQPGKPCCCIRNDETFVTITNFMETGELDTPHITEEEKKYLKDNIANIEIFHDVQDAYVTIVFTKGE